MKKIISTIIIFGAMFTLSSAAPTANLDVTISGPSTPLVNTSYNYTVNVSNSGPATSGPISLVVDMPLTNTSPQVYILGNLTENDTRCNITNNKLNCNLVALKKGKNTTVTFSYVAPVANKSLTMKAIATTNNEGDANNNEFSLTPNVTYPDRVVISGNVTNSHCTGRNLTSYFECLLFPSSIATHSTFFNSNNTITFTEPGYTGTWSQISPKQLKMEYFELGNKVMEFNGYAVTNGNCFEGLSNFTATSTYVSAYRVCM